MPCLAKTRNSQFFGQKSSPNFRSPSVFQIVTLSWISLTLLYFFSQILYLLFIIINNYYKNFDIRIDCLRRIVFFQCLGAFRSSSPSVNSHSRVFHQKKLHDQSIFRCLLPPQYCTTKWCQTTVHVNTEID